MLWATFLGGSGDDYATGVAVDSSGNVLVTGWTRSSDFPVLHALQPTLNNSVSPYRWDAFITKLDPTGKTLIYSTYLGGPDDDGAYAIAVDAGGNAYVTGSLNVAAGFTGFPQSTNGFGMFVSKVSPQGALLYSFFAQSVSFAGLASAAGIAVDSAGNAYVTGTVSSAYTTSVTHSFGSRGASQALVFKLSPDGSKMIYGDTLGGSSTTTGMAIAVDSSGGAYVGGITDSVDFPLMHPLQTSLGARPLWKSNDSGLTWTPIDNLPFAYLQALVADPTSPKTLYAATNDAGFFRSTDGGATWTQANHGLATTQLQSLAIDPVHPQTLFTTGNASSISVYRTVDGGNTWTLVDSTQNSGTAKVAVDPQNPSIVYWNGGGLTRKSTDGGTTWANVPFPGTSITALALDPRASGSIWAYSTAILQKPPLPSTPSYIYHSSDGGATWAQIATPTPANPPGWTIDPANTPSIVYNGLSYRTTDDGATWTPFSASPVSDGTTSAVTVDPSGTLYAAAYKVGIYTSRDHGQTWTAIGALPPIPTYYGFEPNVIGIVPIGTTGTLYAVLQSQQNSGFVTRFSPDGSSLVFSTLLNGHPSLNGWNTVSAEPGVFQTQNWISGIALDPAGNVVVAGGTRSTDFPTANPLQAANKGHADAFVASLAPAGNRLNYSTYFGGSQDDSALALAVDPEGNLVFAGQTWSIDFTPGGVQAPAGQLGDAFVVKLAPPTPPAIASVLNGASYQPGIEAGSWVMIKGANFANTNPGRTWTAAETAGGVLPTSLDGVSVTINSKPAFVYYISPTQINVQTASDSFTGSVYVVVNNNGALSYPVMAQLQSVAPAFFTDLGTNYVLASRLPDYSLVGNTSAAAKPGDTIVLWGTGFGATNPPVAACTVVTGTPFTTAPPTVTVGGSQVEVISSLLTAGAAGLYQITVQLPASLPTGSQQVQASINGVQSAPGMMLYIAAN
jgi:uncharacterized protein (TIGR03437 family)